MAAVYEFPNKISSNHAITWSPDHRISFCTDTAMKIMYINCGVNNLDIKIRCQQSSFPVNADILDIPQMTNVQLKFLFKNLSREELKTLSVDRVMNPWRYQFDTVARTGFAFADWSPEGADAVGRSILATLSQDYRLCLYSHDPYLNEWLQLVDLSVLRCEETQPKLDLKSVTDYNNHRLWCLSQAVTVMKWGTKVYTDTESGQKYILLATGMKSGHLTLWRINIPTPNKSDCSVLYTVKPYDCQISGLTWCPQSDAVLISYLDGQIHILKLSPEDITKEPTWSCVYGESDLMKVSALCVLHKVKTGVYMVLVNKEHCLLAFELDINNYNVISQTHIFLHNTLSASGMCEIDDNTVLMMSQDAMLQKITVSVNENKIQLSAVQANLDLSTSTSWISPGFCVSSNKVLVAFIVRPKPGFDHLSPQWKKTATRLNIRCIDDFTTDLKWRENCVTKLCNPERSIGDLHDVLELFRQHVLSKNCKDIETVDDTGKQCLRRQKLRRYAAKLKHRYNKEKNYDQEELIEELEKETIDLRCKILAVSMQQCVASIEVEKVLSDSNKGTGLAVVYSMYTWLNQHIDRVNDVEGIDDTKLQLGNILTDKKCEMKCYVCNSDLNMNHSRWFCDNGHLFDMCCKSLLPVHGVQYRTCIICDGTARSPESLNSM
ncbi:uncharacterized protein LOC132722647 [Ruditapes philippinarum]|uniref:uncharacterized protein LOC132722647 n=1 Tax=Ruditapes philippinarum TaxID=129788 RepID=UPI00295AB041|nr:uncharacterized protein LOC132722647 [Ruditapes philippinarum]